MSINFLDISFSGKIQHLEYEFINANLSYSPLIIFLHEGLGSLSMWRDYPRQLCEQGLSRTGLFSAGFGKSIENPIREYYSIDCMRCEALDVLSKVLIGLGLDKVHFI